MDLQAHARHQLESQGLVAGKVIARWRANGSNPYFELSDADGAPVRVVGGWYRLDIEISPLGENAGIHPKLYIDYGSGYLEANAFPLCRFVSRVGVSAVVCFDMDVQRLRFDPLDIEGEFCLGRLRISPLSKSSAALRMFAWCIAREGKRLDFAYEAARQAWHARARPRGFGDWLYASYRGIRSIEFGNYENWVRQFDTYTAADLAGMADNARRLASRPLISIVMPTWNTPEQFLSKCIESVQRQVYPYWELCIADDASTAPHVRRVLQRYVKADKRIKVTFREHNGHIAEASNTALELASGEWVALLDHDDELPPHALYAVACEINGHSEAALIYSDEDKIDGIGQRFDPYFKPDWNYDLFLGQNMVSHLGVYRVELLRAVGGFRKGMEGSQDYDLALRCIEQVKPEQIRHIPRVLYHWRAIKGSTAVSTDAKSYAVVAAQRALCEHLARTADADMEVEVHRYGYRVRWPDTVAGRRPKVSLLIPTRDKVELLRTCVESILARTSYPNFEIVVVDNQSTEPAALAYLEELGNSARVRVLHYDKPFNFSAINNYAVQHCDGEILGLLNNDIEVIHVDWLDEMVGQVLRPEVGAVGAMLYYPDDTIQHAGVLIGVHGVAAHAYSRMPRGHGGQISRARLAQELSAVTAACLVVRRDVYEKVRGLDERFQVAFNDVDFCLRVRKAGYRNIWTPFAELYHHESASRGYEDSPEKKSRFEGEMRFMTERWGDELRHDPAYNPNLTLSGVPFDLAFPPRVARLV